MAKNKKEKKEVPDKAEDKTKADKKAPFEIEYENPCCVTITVQADGDKLQQEYEEQFRTYLENAQLPGFRPGKAPRYLVERKFGESLKNQVLYSESTELFNEAVKKDDLTVVNELEIPEFETQRWEPGENISLKYRCEVVPSIELEEQQYKDIEIKVPSEDIPEDIFENALNQFAQRFSEWNELDKDKSVDENDSVQAEIKIVSPELESELKEREYHFRPVDKRIGPFSVDGLKGAAAGSKAGDTLEVDAAITEEPGDDADPALKELKEADNITMEVALKTIYRLHTPEINADLASKLGLDSPDEIKEIVRSQVDQDMKRQRREYMQSELLSKLVDLIDVELPDSLVKQTAEEDRRRTALRLWREGRDKEEIQRQVNADDSFDQNAERALKVSLILNKIAEKERIYVSESEVDEQIRSLAASRGMEEERARRMLEKQDMLDSLRKDLRRSKIIDSLLENARLNEVEWSELEKSGD